MNLTKLRAEWSPNITRDILAGTVVALALIPEAIAFSLIAGVDPKVGLYASFCIAVITAIAGGRPAMISAATGAMALVMVTLARGRAERCARGKGLRVAAEGFADRAYNADGTLVSRRLPGSLIDDPRRAAEQAVHLAREGSVRTIDGKEIDLSVQTICCHGDTPGAPPIVRAVREALERAGCRVRPMGEFLAGG